MAKSIPSLFDLTFNELQTLMSTWGEAAFRAKQVWNWLYVQLADRYESMTNLSTALRDRLQTEYPINRLTRKLDVLSTDGWTRKILFALPDGAQIETVLMEYDTRNTACVSTQAGCAMGCTFCATGQAGFQRNLSSGEIIEQVLFFERELRASERETKTKLRMDKNPGHTASRHESGGDSHRLTNVVFMGMGEPFANYNQLMDALTCLNDPAGYSFGARRMTVSTVGLVPMIERFTQERSQVNLAVSLHAATNELRETMLPINKRFPLNMLMQACRAYTEKTHRRISFEWALIEGVNDTADQARLLVRLIKGLLCHVNLIPLNPTRDFAGQASTRDRIAAFRLILDQAGIPNSLRIRRGIDINAGCGQLRQAAIAEL